MRALRRVLCIAVVLTMTLVGLTACGERKDDRDQLRSALRRTERKARKYVYEEKLPKSTQTIRGVVVDDLKYKAQYLIDGDLALEEIVVDDALAVRTPESDGLALFLRKGVSPPPPPPEANGVTAVEALELKRWVLDAQGAPSLTGSTEKRLLGDDPVRDSLSVFRYIEDAIGQSIGVSRFNPDSLDPVYKAKEDPFPPPKEGSDILRYDFRQRKLPEKAQASSGQALPGVNSFRKMAVYVKDGLVVEVREVIDVESLLDELRKRYEIEYPEGFSDTEKAEFAVQVINAVRKGSGQDPIRLRTMRLVVSDLGRPGSVDLPTEDVVPGDLTILRGRGRIPKSAKTTEGESTDSETTADSETTTDSAPTTDSTTSTSP